MSPKAKSYVLTGRSATMTFGLPGSDETLTLERGVPTDVPSAFSEQVEQAEDVYPEGSVPDDAITGPPVPPEPADEEPADEPQPSAPAETSAGGETPEPSPDQA